MRFILFIRIVHLMKVWDWIFIFAQLNLSVHLILSPQYFEQFILHHFLAVLSMWKKRVPFSANVKQKTNVSKQKYLKSSKHYLRIFRNFLFHNFFDFHILKKRLFLSIQTELMRKNIKWIDRTVMLTNLQKIEFLLCVFDTQYFSWSTLQPSSGVLSAWK